MIILQSINALHCRHHGHDCVSNHRLFKRRSKKTSKLRVTGLCAGNSLGPVNSPHKWPVTRKMSPFDDVITECTSQPGVKWVGGKVQTLERSSEGNGLKPPFCHFVTTKGPKLDQRSQKSHYFWRLNKIIVHLVSSVLSFKLQGTEIGSKYNHL